MQKIPYGKLEIRCMKKSMKDRINELMEAYGDDPDESKIRVHMYFEKDNGENQIKHLTFNKYYMLNDDGSVPPLKVIRLSDIKTNCEKCGAGISLLYHNLTDANLKYCPFCGEKL